MRENQALRKRLETEEEAKRQAELAKLGDVERLQKQYEAESASRKAAQERAAQLEAQLIAKNLGIAYPELAVAAIREKLKYSADGKPENAEDLLKEFLTSYPLLTPAPQQTPNTAPAPAPQPAGIFPANASQSSQSARPAFDPRNPPRWSDVPFKGRS